MIMKEKTNTVGTEILIRDFSEPLQNQMPTSTSYSSTFIQSMDFNYGLDAQSLVAYENQLINIWRAMAKNPYIDFAIDDIVNEMISFTDGEKYPIRLNLNNTTFSKTIRTKIHDEWVEIMKMLRFHKKSYSLIRDWFVDGKQYFYVEYDKKSIKKIIPLDPIRTKKVVKEDSKEVKYIYQDSDISQKVLEFDKEHIFEVNSGLMDDRHTVWISYLNKAYIPLNQLNNIEDAILIYRIARAPERRVIYIDTGGLNANKAQEYMQDVINNLKNKVEYDPSSGKIKESTLHMSLLEDIFLPRSDDRQGTEITTLAGGQSGFSDLSDLDYFKQKLFRSLNVPYTRWSENTQSYAALGRAAEISRDELKYRKYIIRLRHTYSSIFTYLLRLQCTLKNIISEREYNDNYDDIIFDWSSDSAFSEMRDLEIITERLNIVDRMIPYLGTLFSNQYIRTNILHQTDEMISDIKTQNEYEKQNAEGNDLGSDGQSMSDDDSGVEI